MHYYYICVRGTAQWADNQIRSVSLIFLGPTWHRNYYIITDYVPHAALSIPMTIL